MTCCRLESNQLSQIRFSRTSRHRSACCIDRQLRFHRNKKQVHTRSLQAEENAFLQISKYGGRGIEGGRLFPTASPL